MLNACDKKEPWCQERIKNRRSNLLIHQTSKTIALTTPKNLTKDPLIFIYSYEICF